MPTCWFEKHFHMLKPLCECFATTSPWWRGLSAWDNLSFNGQLITWAHSQVVNILLLGLYTIECFLRAYVERAKYPCNRPPKGVVVEKGLGWEILSIWAVSKTVLAGVPGCTVRSGKDNGPASCYQKTPWNGADVVTWGLQKADCLLGLRLDPWHLGPSWSFRRISYVATTL